MSKVAYNIYINQGFGWETTPLQLLGGVLCRTYKRHQEKGNFLLTAFRSFSLLFQLLKAAKGN